MTVSQNDIPVEQRSELEYWKKVVAQNQSLKLPTDHARKQNVQDISYLTTQEFPLSFLGSDSFKRYVASQAGELDINEASRAFVLTLFSVLLTRYTGEETFVLGLNNHGKALMASIEIRQPPQDASFSSLFKRNVSALDAAESNVTNDFSLEQILAVLIPRVTETSDYDRRTALTTLIQASFGSSNDKLALQSQIPFVLAHVDVHLHLNLSNHSVSISYRKDLFSLPRIIETIKQLMFLGEQVLDADQSIFDYSLVTSEAKSVLPQPDIVLSTEWHGSVHDHFEKQVAQKPDATCVTDSRETLTFDQLNRIGNQLSRKLLQRGLKRQEVVAILGHRSTAMVWAILAVMKCAASFTILDPAYPPQRIIDCMSVATPAVVIHIEATGSIADQVDEYMASDDSSVRFIEHIGSPLSALKSNKYAEFSDQNLGQASVVGPDDVAVITFTSGSTGMPKGVMGRHGPLTHYYPFIRDHFNMSEKDRFSMQSGISHDPLQRDIFTPWFLGAEIFIPDPEDIVNPGRLAQWFHENAITVTHLTPAMGQLLTSAAGTAENRDLRLTHLRWAFFVGDVLTKKFVKRMCDIAPNVTVINLYGSTETQRSVTFYLVPKPGTEEFIGLKDILPIGRGMRDVQSLILSRFTTKQQLCGIGEVGEIYMRSPHLSKGYKGKDEENREKFLPNPFVVEEHRDRMYRTGDLGRYLPSGDAECSGRADDQVKIRGFRIELGEINTALNSHEWVKESVTIVRTDQGSDEKRIVTYFVWDLVELKKQGIDPLSNPGIMIRDLRKYIRTKLPDYMIPAHFVLLDKLPLTPNGKIKHADLPPPVTPLDMGVATDKKLQDEGYASPRNALEKQLHEIWRQVLGVNQISVHDGFFDLGGHSISATTLTLKIRQQIPGAETLPVELLFKAPTIAALAVAIELLRSGRKDARQANLIDLSQEAILDPHIRPSQPDQIVILKQPRHVVTWFKYQEKWKNPQNVLLTGCTGFLGAFILTDLLKDTDSMIHCLVRARDLESASERIKDSLLQHHLLWTTQEQDDFEEREEQHHHVVNKKNIDQIMQERIVPIIGDLSSERLGLSQETFDKLSDEIDVIIHNGAVVHWMYPYERLKAANVNGTIEIIRMAAGGKKLKPIHYISTTSVFDSQGYSNLSDVYEDTDLPYHEDLNGGYPQSKWVAERLIMNARRRGVPTCIYRPGYVTGHSQTGVWNPDDYLCRMIKGCIQLGMYPDLPHSKLDMSPVDFVSRAIVYLFSTRESLERHKAYHLVNPNEFFFNALLETGVQLGYQLKKVSFDVWKQALFDAVKRREEGDNSQEENALMPMLTHFTEDFARSMGAGKRPWYDNTHTLEGLYDSGIECPPVDRLIGTYYQFLCKCGFLSPPEKMTEFARELQLDKIHNTSDVFNAVSDVAVRMPKSYQGLMRNNKLNSNSDLENMK
jgi:L-aminoadipate-semialdehyde dehydrogenase